MKYTIKDALSNNPDEITITAEEFDSIKNAKRILSAGLSIEEKYEVLLGNYEDLEKEIVNTSIDSMLNRPRKHNDFRIYMAKFNKRMTNLLTASCLYVDHVKHHVSEITMKSSEIKCKVNRLFSDKYNKYIEYRFMEALRDYVQHRGFPVHYINLQSWVIDVNDPKGKVAHTIDFSSQKRILEEDRKFKKTILPELNDNIDLKMATRKYMECFSEIQPEIRQIVSGNLTQARQLIEDYITRFNEKFNQQTKALSAIASDDDRNEVDELDLLLDWDDLRVDLADKNRVLKNLSRTYVTGETKITQSEK